MSDVIWDDEEVDEDDKPVDDGEAVIWDQEDKSSHQTESGGAMDSFKRLMQSVGGGLVHQAADAAELLAGPRSLKDEDIPKSFGKYELSDSDRLLLRAKSGDIGLPAQSVAKGVAGVRQVVDKMPGASLGPQVSAKQEELLGNGSYDENLAKEKDRQGFRKEMYGGGGLQDFLASLAAYGIGAPAIESAAGRIAAGAGISGLEGLGEDQSAEGFAKNAAIGAVGSGAGEATGALAEGVLNGFAKDAASKTAGAKADGLKAAEAELNKNYASAQGKQGAPVAEAMKVVRDQFGNAVPKSLLGPTEKAALEAQREQAKAIAREQALKGAEVLKNYVPPRNIPVPTPADAARLAETTMAEQAAASRGALRGAFVEKGGNALLNAAYDVPVAGKLLKGGVGIVQSGRAAHGTPGARADFWTRAAKILASEPGRLGKFHSVVMGALAGKDSPQVVDFVMSQTDPDWRQMKSDIEEGE